MWKHTQESAECSEYAIQVMWYGTMREFNVDWEADIVISLV